MLSAQCIAKQQVVAISNEMYAKVLQRDASINSRSCDWKWHFTHDANVLCGPCILACGPAKTWCSVHRNGVSVWEICMWRSHLGFTVAEGTLYACDDDPSRKQSMLGMQGRRKAGQNDFCSHDFLGEAPWDKLTASKICAFPFDLTRERSKRPVLLPLLRHVSSMRLSFRCPLYDSLSPP